MNIAPAASGESGDGFRNPPITFRAVEVMIEFVLHENAVDWATAALACGTFSCATRQSNHNLPMCQPNRPRVARRLREGVTLQRRRNSRVPFRRRLCLCQLSPCLGALAGFRRLARMQRRGAFVRPQRQAAISTRYPCRHRTNTPRLALIPCERHRRGHRRG